jgi:NAD(P)-dependent dehydrogenase (short-subunit alcohol dehydrogenase family)
MPEPKAFYDRLRGKVALVTGAGVAGYEPGIGCAIALVLAREGARLVCVDLDENRAQATVDMIAKAGGKAISVAGDVTKPADCERFIAETIAAFGRIDVLVNNVGTASIMTLEAVQLAQWQHVIDTNLTSAMLMSKFAVPRMVATGGGSIVNISSVAGMRSMGTLAYGPTKAAMHQLAREISVMYGRKGIRANTVAPGHVFTPFVKDLLPPGAREARRKVSPLGLEGDSWDIAQAALFLASDESRFIAGVQLPVDGGVDGIAALTGAQLLGAPD